MKKTPLYERHLSLGAKMIDFGGWLMPVQYTNVIEEHHATRTGAGLFDICHMGEIAVKGPQAFALLQRVVSRNLEDQAVGRMKLCILTNEQGGILDDLTVYKLESDHYLLVTNAAGDSPASGRSGYGRPEILLLPEHDRGGDSRPRLQKRLYRGGRFRDLCR
jgi:aminomethyltransferase